MTKLYALENNVLSTVVARHEANMLSGGNVAQTIQNSPLLTVHDGFGVIDIRGIIEFEVDQFARFFGEGGVTTVEIQEAFQQFLDTELKDLIFHINSPGGDANGVEQLANMIYSVRDSVNTIAVIEGQGTSGGYWLAAACEKIYISGKTTVCGSIGVYATHVDRSQHNLQNGTVYTDVSAGKFKTITSQNLPLSKEGFEELKRQTSTMYDIFVGYIAKYRGVSETVVLENMAGGLVFFGEHAVKLGLADGIKTLEDVVANVVNLNNVRSNPRDRKRENMGIKDDKKIEITSVDVLKEEYSTLTNQIQQNSYNKGILAERARLQKIDACAIPGNEVLMAKLKYETFDSAEDSYFKILSSEKQFREKTLGDLHLESTEVNVGVDNGKSASDIFCFESKVRSLMSEGNMKRSDALRVAVKNFPTEYANLKKEVRNESI